MVVFLKCHNGLIKRVYRNKLRLGISWCNVRQTCQISDDRLITVRKQSCITQTECRKMPSRILRNDTIVQVFIPLVLNGNCKVFSVRAKCNTVRLSGHITFCDDLIGFEINNCHITRRLYIAFRGINPDISIVTFNSHRCRLTTNIYYASGFRVGRIKYINFTNRLQFGVRVNKHRSLHRRCNNLSNRFCRFIFAFGQIFINWKRRQAAKRFNGKRRCCKTHSHNGQTCGLTKIFHYVDSRWVVFVLPLLCSVLISKA